MPSPSRPVVLAICLAALGLGVLASTTFDGRQEARGVSSLAREAHAFTLALEGGSMTDALAHVTTRDRGDPRAQAVLRQLHALLRGPRDLRIQELVVEPDGRRAVVQFVVASETPQGPQATDGLRIPWSRGPDGAWRAELVRR